jgi:DNA polymerase
LPARKKTSELKKLRKAVILACKKHPAFKGAVPVFGEGPCPCDIMIVGEAPGRKETELKKPFVGRAGGFFTALFQDALKRPREKIYITNVVKVWLRIETRRGRTRPPTKKEESFFRRCPRLCIQTRRVGGRSARFSDYARLPPCIYIEKTEEPR